MIGFFVSDLTTTRHQALKLIENVGTMAPDALDAVAAGLPEGFPPTIHEMIRDVVTERLRGLEIPDTSAV